MGERRRAHHDDTGPVATEEAPTARALHQRYAAEKARDQRDADRLIELRDKAVEEGLTAEEQVERLVLEQARDDREPRLQRFLREAVTAQGDLDIEQVLASWDALVVQKDGVCA